MRSGTMYLWERYNTDSAVGTDLNIKIMYWNTGLMRSGTLYLCDAQCTALSAPSVWILKVPSVKTKISSS